jgi:hypothetical protein
MKLSPENPTQMEFRFRPSQPNEMPDAFAVIEEAGIYFCDNGGARESVAVLFRRIIDKALACADSTQHPQVIPEIGKNTRKITPTPSNRGCPG